MVNIEVSGAVGVGKTVVARIIKEALEQHGIDVVLSANLEAEAKLQSHISTELALTKPAVRIEEKLTIG